MQIEAERIAKGLTRPQREALLEMNPGRAWHTAPKIGSLRAGRACTYLTEKGCFAARYEKANGLLWFRWTPLGRRVAAALRAQENRDEG